MGLIKDTTTRSLWCGSYTETFLFYAVTPLLKPTPVFNSSDWNKSNTECHVSFYTAMKIQLFSFSMAWLSPGTSFTLDFRKITAKIYRNYFEPKFEKTSCAFFVKIYQSSWEKLLRFFLKPLCRGYEVRIYKPSSQWI